ncbi:MAG TPA: DUF2934 domain-containing protein [Opitutaceae bacterium]
MITPTHDEIAQQAHKLWQDRGCPDGFDTEIWLQAEHELMETAAAASEIAIEHRAAHAAAEHEAETVAIQKQEARAPQMPHHNAPRGKPAETGKPLWKQPHSS